ncbi:MAG: glycolate oxidase subunit GlcD [Acidobacteria bacterium RIFCSPLOWO2_02_FULL_68_18]|nr:MAG: glycolate oxidase subunit GlcD [Acidobacteria bacterium RIFCSPLOWO2_02_FULL_68_18]OFW51022.1 MAG: glycolate oxidase subunit GlcD [Acidobacteria bacterium RIFCSPLOWO2_12_FULL_68_19]
MPATLDARIVRELERISGGGSIVRERLELLTYECDALPHMRAEPALVVLPSSAAEIQAIVRICSREGVPFVARGHGTGLSGGALPVPGGVVIGLSRLNRVLDIDVPNRRVTVEPGVTNLEITRRVAPYGYYYAPDPSSQQVCSIGGNVAENSGGAHCLKYGFTTHHVLALDAVMPDGELVHLDSAMAGGTGPDLVGLIVGSEGTLAVVTRAVVRILRRPESVRTLLAAFDSISGAGAAVSDIIAAGIVPGAVEMMDALAIEAAEAAVHPGFPAADAVLIVELDGPEPEVAELFPLAEQICRRTGATSIEVATSDAHRARIWTGRKAAFAAMGRVSPNYYVQDGVVPRTKLPEVLGRVRQLEARCGLRIANVFHAGDGNLHPLICYDEKVPGQADRAVEAAGEILTYCVEAGGSITGEHGVGMDKREFMPKMFTDDDLDVMQRVREAIDPKRLCNPGKVFPTPRLCGEVPGPYREHPTEKAGLAERF